MNELKRTEAYEALPVDVKALYSSSVAATLNRQLIEKYAIQTTSVDDFLETTGDVILGFHTTSELPALLQKKVGVSADDAMRIMGELKEFLAPVIAREKGEVHPNRAELQELQKAMTPPPTATTPTTQQEDADGENTPVLTPTPVQAMRTMEGDMSRIHGYGAYRAEFPEEPQEAEHTEKVIRSASQQDLLQEKPKLAGMPTYEEKE